MVDLLAKHYDGRIAMGRPAKLTISGRTLQCEIDGTPREYALAEVRLSPRAGNTSRFIYLPDGGQLCCEANDDLEALTTTDKSESFVSWLDARWWVALVAIGATALSLVMMYSFGLPLLAQLVAARVPPAQEHRLGERALDTFDKSGIFTESEISDQWQQEVERSFDRLIAGNSLGAEVDITLRKAPLVGPNAFALPGRVIVVTDSMVELCGTQDELAAIVAHELGHIEGRHPLRSMLQNAGVSAAIGLLLGDVASAVALGTVPTVLASLKYSRSMESQADEFAVRLLASRGIDPGNLVRVLKRLMEHEGLEVSEYAGYLSTHPNTNDRIAHVGELAGQLQQR
jgi:predicted Zn-dependent protease